MTLVAGVDIGNSTTELVIADTSASPPVPVAWDRASTRGVKGSADAARGAAALLTRLERRSGVRAARALITEQVPVHTRRVDVPLASAETGPLVLLSRGVATPAGIGHGVGRPIDLADEIPAAGRGPVVLVARDPLGYRSTVERVARWTRAGHPVVAVLLAGDEAALVSARLGIVVPVVDGIDADAALACDVVAVEVAPPGHHVRTLADPIWLTAALELQPGDHASAQRVSAMTYGHRSAAIGRSRHPRRVRTGDEAVAEAVLRDGRTVPLVDALAVIAEAPVGSVRQYRLPGEPAVDTDDLWLVDLDALSGLPGLRSGSIDERRLLLAALSPESTSGDPATAFSRSWGGRVDVVATEAQASRAGALTTPGIGPDAWVVDLGGGTLDAIGPAGAVLTAAGCGELMTSAVAHALTISSGAAEWVKRGPASRIESPSVVADESGERRFLLESAPHGTVGWLVAPGPSGGLPFSRTLALAEWRAIRLSLKHQVFASNLARVLAGLGGHAGMRDVVVIGGPAGDDEILEALNPALGAAVVGRADVAGVLGHRWAVAYGLVMSASGR